MDLYGRDPTVTKAMALALMRQALEMLDAVDERSAGCQLQTAIDTLLRAAGKKPDRGAGPD